MENINIGIVNLVLSNKIRETYFSNEMINESKSLLSEFINVVKTSPILQLEFNVFDNIENKNIENELMATRYIDNNIKLFEVYTINEIDNERKKLKRFIGENSYNKNSEKVKLYEAIDVLIHESINDYDKIDVDKMHEAFTLVLNHVRKPKRLDETTQEFEDISEEILEIAIHKFNERYSILSEDDKNLLNTLVQSDATQKLKLLETFKTETLSILNNYSSGNTDDEVKKAIGRINEMTYTIDSDDFKQKIDEDIIKLHELKKDLL